MTAPILSANAQNRVRVAFEFIEKLGAPFYCWHDRDVAPEGKNAFRDEQKLSTPSPRF
jgi:xylose isomerase